MSNQTIPSDKETIRLAYCEASSAANNVAQSLIGKVVGKVQVTVPQEYDDRSYECAAWSEQRISGTGVFDIVIRQDCHNKSRLFLAAELPATVKSDFFPSLFCGNLIGKGYDSTQNVGKPCRNIVITRDMADAVCKTEASDPDKDGTKWAILPEFWQMIADYYRALAHQFMVYFPLTVADYQATIGGEDKHGSALRQMGYAGEKVNENATKVEEIVRRIEFRASNSKDYFAINNPFVESSIGSKITR